MNGIVVAPRQPSGGHRAPSARGSGCGRHAASQRSRRTNVPDVQTRAVAKIGLRPRRANLLRCLRGLASERPDDAAFAYQSDEPAQRTAMTYAQLDRRARAIAACLQDMDLVGQR